jgi:indole-3-glycerol phosphate synthase
MTILDQIVRSTRDLLHVRKNMTPEARLTDLPLFGDPRRPFGDALRQPGVSIIAEIKKASPSKGVLRENLDVARVASQYEQNGAAAISVVTEPAYFQGTLDNLRIARETTGIPMLRKDFILDPYQLFEARAHGADAVLLIATVLDRIHLKDLLEAADEIGLDHLVEVYAERDLDTIDFDLVRIIGANNRDLETFEVDVRRASRILRHVPAGIVRVAESGIRDAADVAIAAEGGADAVLVGEALMSADDPGIALRALTTGEVSRNGNNNPTEQERA